MNLGNDTELKIVIFLFFGKARKETLAFRVSDGVLASGLQKYFNLRWRKPSATHKVKPAHAQKLDIKGCRQLLGQGPDRAPSLAPS